VNVRHGFRRYNEVKPLARHVHQKRFSSSLLDVRHARTVAQRLGHWLGTSTRND